MKISFIEDRVNHLVLFAKALCFKRFIFEFSVTETLFDQFSSILCQALTKFSNFFWFLFHLTDGNYFLVFTFSNVVRLQVPPKSLFIQD